MDIIEKNKDIEVNELIPGNCFKYGDSYFSFINNETETISNLTSVVDLNDGDRYAFADKTKVQRVPCKLIIEEG